MSVPELLPGIPVDIPPDQAPYPLVVFAHGLGDLPDGPMGATLSKLLPREGVAVARLPLAARVGENDVVPYPISQQAELVSLALEAAASQYPRVHAVGHSLGTLSIAEGALEADVSDISVTLLAPPLTNGRHRLEKEMTRGETPEAFTGHDLHAVVPLPQIGRHIGLTPQFWSEISAFQPLPLISEVFAARSTWLVRAGADERFGLQEAETAQLPASLGSKLETIPSANHHFSRHRREVAARLALLIKSQSVSIKV